MSFIGASTKGVTYAPGWFLVNNEDVSRETKEIKQAGATSTDDGAKYVKMGTPYPSNDADAIGIVYEDVDVTNGNMPGSVVTKGEVYLDRLAVELDDAAKSALEGAGFKFVEAAPSVVRPY